MNHPARSPSLVGIGLYMPAEAGRLLGLPARKITRWLAGHRAGVQYYEPLWKPQIELDGGAFALGFRDLIEVRVADAFLRHGLSPRRVRRAIDVARDIIGDRHPLSTARFKTDGRSIFLQVAKEDDEPQLLDVLASQYAIRSVIETSLSNIDFGEDGAPTRWWPKGRACSILIDPERSFGQPIEAETAVPVSILAAAAAAEGTAEAAAKAWNVPVRAVRRAVAFNDTILLRQAA